MRHLSWLHSLGSGLLCLGVLVGMAARMARAEADSAGLVAYRIVDGAIPEPLTNAPGDPERGRRIILDREQGDCTVCHAMPLPQRQFHGSIGPPLDGIGSRSSAAQLRLRLVDPQVLQPHSVMPAYYKVEGLHRVLARYHGKALLSAQGIEDVVAYLLTLTQE